ncbi:MAG: O-sialoglycoprotein endopeptidase [Aminipila sp.]
MENNYILGIDTSNYKTSIAIVDKYGTIALDERSLLRVKKGERGLRQSEALFQHIENLPILFEKVKEQQIKISAVAVSNKPRPVEGSYMPCFKAGYGFGKAIACSMNVPIFEFSHQEGHLEAIKYFTQFKDSKSFLAWHLSGGTCELLKVNSIERPDIVSDNQERLLNIDIVGGSKDISFGQVIDRIGVLLGMNFPAGAEMDLMALKEKENNIRYIKKLTKIKTEKLYFNLSGIETQCGRTINNLVECGSDNSEMIRMSMAGELFDKIIECITLVTREASKTYGIKDIIFVGGVSSSKYISDQLKNTFCKGDINIDFGPQELSGDNAVGIALLGGKAYGHKTG